jgi:hypothetical protein
LGGEHPDGKSTLAMKLKKEYRITEESFVEAKTEDPSLAVMEAVWRDYVVCPKRQRASFLARLTPGQRAFLFLGSLAGQIQSDGFYCYLWNSGDEVPATLDALQLIGAKRYVAILRAAIRLFLNQSVLKNRRLRQAALKKIAVSDIDKRFRDPFDDLNERKKTSFQGLQLVYLRQHRDEFLLPAGQTRSAEAAKVAPRDYRVSRKKARKLHGEALHWALIAKIWDDYWEALRTGKSLAAEFIAELSPGQRALVAIDILDKQVLRMGGFKEVVGFYHCPDLFISEACAAYNLLRARPYADLLQRVIKMSTEKTAPITALTQEVTELRREKEKLKLLPGMKAFASLTARFRQLYDERSERERERAEAWEKLNAEFRVLIDSPKTRIETYIEAYVNVHPDEFFRE